MNQIKIKKYAGLFITVFTMIFSACSGGPSLKSESSIFTENLGTGWNLGNTLDAHKGENSKTNYGLSTETSWGMPETTRGMIHSVASKGFKTIRIPVSWHNHITDESISIDEAWLNRVKQIVDWSLEEGFYVIINIHHDNLKSASMSQCYGYSLNENYSEQTVSKKYIKAVWSQVADFFSDYDEHLIFETLNEPRNRDSVNDGFTAPDNVSELNKIISKYNQAAVDAIRNAGGKNADRYIMVPWYAASPYDSRGWSVPEDSAESRILISVHGYTPYDFCMSDISDKTFEVTDEGADIDYMFRLLTETYGAKGFGIVLGETSATDKHNDSERVKWAQYMSKAAKEAGVVPVLWDNMNLCQASGGNGDINSGECHGYFDRSSLNWWFPEFIKNFIGK